jgi:uroporphyrinogen-III synthase
MRKNRPLAGKFILVTRPAEQAGELAALITGAGGRPVLFPAIEVRDLEDMRPFFTLVDRLEDFDFAIFISPNAVGRAMKRMLERRALPAGLKIIAVGGGTARALANCGVSDVIAPRQRYDSEALLDLPELATPGNRRVVIFRGQGGRELLGDALNARGARVEYAECYRRCRPEIDPAPVLDAWRRGELDAVTVTSSEGLRNLYEIVGNPGRDLLVRTPLFVPHPRIAEAARELQVQSVVVTGPHDTGLLTGMTAYFSARARRGQPGLSNRD